MIPSMDPYGDAMVVLREFCPCLAFLLAFPVADFLRFPAFALSLHAFRPSLRIVPEFSIPAIYRSLAQRH